MKTHVMEEIKDRRILQNTKARFSEGKLYNVSSNKYIIGNGVCSVSNQQTMCTNDIIDNGIMVNSATTQEK